MSPDGPPKPYFSEQLGPGLLKSTLGGKTPSLIPPVPPLELGGSESLLPGLWEGAQCEIQLTLRCLWMSPVPATLSKPCPVSPAQFSRQIPAMLGDHSSPHSKFLLLHSLSIFSPTLMHPSPTPDLPKRLPSLILLPKHTQRLLFAAFCAFSLASSTILVLQLLFLSPTVSEESKSSPSLAVV